MRGYPYIFSGGIPITLAKNCFSPIVTTFAKIPLYKEGGTVLKAVFNSVTIQTNNTMSQSELESNICILGHTRENACQQDTIGWSYFYYF